MANTKKVPRYISWRLFQYAQRATEQNWALLQGFSRVFEEGEVQFIEDELEKKKLPKHETMTLLVDRTVLYRTT